MATINSIKVRMYRHGFGDCFLLQFYSGSKRHASMLIDCGLKRNDSVDTASMDNVVKDIIKTLKTSKNSKPKLDILVATHEHWDHVSGFHPNKKYFDNIEIQKIWMAWTEDPDDKEAKTLNSNLRKEVTALRLAAAKIKENKEERNSSGYFSVTPKGQMMLFQRNEFIKGLESIVDFFGPLEVSTSASGIKLKNVYKKSIETQKAINYLRELSAHNAGISYFNPGDLIDNISILPGIRIYILGPPRSAFLNKDKPSSGDKKEVYFSNNRHSMMGFVNGALRLDPSNANLVDDGSPFGDVTCITRTEAKSINYFKKTYFDKSEEWRMIDDDWLDIAGALALQMDNDTNNTSLVMAIEFVESGKILLFPGDAQVGSWLSWHDLNWNIKKGNQKEKITAEYILQNSVFYKASHHSSHNATLKEKGLEMMTHDELVVFVPEKNDQYGGIPYTPLIKRLKEKAKGRVLFSADKNYPPEQIKTDKPEGLSNAEWKQFKARITINDLFVEYNIQE